MSTRRVIFIALFMVLPGFAAAQALVPVRTIPSKSILNAGDLVRSDLQIPGALTSVEDVIGMEAKITLYVGRPLRPGDIGPAAVVERNQIVPLIFSNALLRIETEGRVLDRAAPGERVRAMNMSSRTIVIGTVTKTGSIEVGP